MEPLRTYRYSRKNEKDTQEIIIREKDYGEMIVYDILCGGTVLFTLAPEGTLVFSDWEKARAEPYAFSEETLNGIRSFILKQQRGEAS
ncbi:hypothetical protein [Compostibacter hankyongensis]|uniref:Uncharacterized protein n=1 Tax=Compostibacter hankyongensis TaxID=1007089 RepID=A0ABP8FYR2_9BACT